jgi:hypothetical protein
MLVTVDEGVVQPAGCNLKPPAGLCECLRTTKKQLLQNSKASSVP